MALSKPAEGWLYGTLGMLTFSASLPATRLMVAEIDPFFGTVTRASIAGLIATILLIDFREKRPGRGDLVPLLIAALGVVVGFPLLTALALKEITAAQSLLFTALLPLSTATFAVLRGGERPRPVFWLFALLGSAAVLWFALGRGAAGAGTVGTLAGNLMMIGAVIVCGLGYAEGGKLSRTLGGWQVICWALLLSLPVMLPLAIFTIPNNLATVTLPAWLGLGYVSLFSMLIGFIFWYRGLAAGGIAVVGQLQLLQPFFGLLLAALILHEVITVGMLGVLAFVILCVAGAKRFS